MRSRMRVVQAGAVMVVVLAAWPGASGRTVAMRVGAATVHAAVAADRSRPLSSMAPVAFVAFGEQTPSQRSNGAPAEAPKNAAGAKVEQTTMGAKPAAELVASFDGLGVGFEGPHGMSRVSNPSDNSLAVGPDHIVQTVNTRFAIFTKKGKKYDTTGTVLYGAVPNNTVFAGFTGTCERTNNGDTVVRYDQLADRWLVVMPIFRQTPARPDQPEPWKAGDTVWTAPPGVRGQPGPAAKLFVPPPATPTPTPAPGATPTPTPAPARGANPARGQTGQPGATPTPPPPPGSYSMCYAVSVTSDPMGEYYRYEFLRPLFPDYPRPAVWPDGYYVPTSTSDDFVQKQACVVDRQRMLKGEPATEQCVIIDGVNFLNNADLEGKRPPPAGAPNILLAAGGTQLNGVFGDDGVYVWQFKVDWANSANTKLAGPVKIPVAPYQYLCRGQLTNCVPQPGTERRLDAQGDKLMARVSYRNLGSREAIVAVHSVNTEAAGGGVRWYEFQASGAAGARKVALRQQGTYAPDGFYRWMASPAIDRLGNIGMGYSFGGTPNFAGQRFAGRLANDPLGQLTLRETILIEGQAAQTSNLRWEDYSQTAVDPSDDCTIWYVGDYYKKDATTYSTRIGGLRMPGCHEARGLGEQSGAEVEWVAMTKRILATVVAIAVCGACGGATPKDTSADETKLKAELGVWFDKYNAGDADGVASLYAEDAISLPDKAPAASGRAAIRAYLAADIARARTAGVTFHAGAPTGLGVSGDVAWLSGTYTVNDPTGMVVDSGKYLAICHRREGDWAIVRDTWNEDTPPPPAAALEAAAPAAAPAAKPAPPAGSAKSGGKLSAITHVFHR